jgi:hypothetical protein
MAALALMGAIMTGCSGSGDDGIADSPQPVITPQQPANNSKTVTLTTTVGLDDGSAGTRALTADGTKTFAAGDQIALIYTQNGGATAKAVSAALPEGTYGKSAEFTFELTNPKTSEPVTYIYPAAMAGETGVDYSKLSSQTGGTLTDLGSKYDLATYTHAWDGNNLPTATLANQLAILAVTLKDDAETPADITSTITGMTISDGTNSYAVTRSAAAGPIYVAIRPTTGATFNVTATDGTNNYVKTLTGKTYEINNGYNVGWRMLPAVIDLSSVSGDITVISGQTLTGRLADNYKVSIAAGAEVTLSGATIPGRNTTELTTRWAGITCKGDATIVLADGTENYVKGYDSNYPGIQAGPTGTTLTIRGGSSGTGKLTAHCGMSTQIGYGAGIGGGGSMVVGNIRIEGGDITATASFGGAGIGCGYERSSCGDITITGGTVTATGSDGAAGIGSGQGNSSCDDITITGGTVTATGGSLGAGIGSGNGDGGTADKYTSCGNITIEGGTVTATGGYGAAGIGSGADFSSCGNITITGGTGTAKGGTDSPYHIGKGGGNNASCGTVSVAANTINCLWKTVLCEFSVSLLGGIDIKTCATITINDGIRDYVVTDPTFTGNEFLRNAQFEAYLDAPHTNATITFTATGGDLGSNVFTGSISGVTIKETDDNVFDTVLLTKQNTN